MCLAREDLPSRKLLVLGGLIQQLLVLVHRLLRHIVRVRRLPLASPPLKVLVARDHAPLAAAGTLALHPNAEGLAPFPRRPAASTRPQGVLRLRPAPVHLCIWLPGGSIWRRVVAVGRRAAGAEVGVGHVVQTDAHEVAPRVARVALHPQRDVLVGESVRVLLATGAARVREVVALLLDPRRRRAPPSPPAPVQRQPAAAVRVLEERETHSAALADAQRRFEPRLRPRLARWLLPVPPRPLRASGSPLVLRLPVALVVIGQLPLRLDVIPRRTALGAGPAGQVARDRAPVRRVVAV